MAMMLPEIGTELVFMPTGETYRVLGYNYGSDPKELDFNVRVLSPKNQEISIRASQFLDGRYRIR